MRRLLFTCCIALGFSFVAVPKASADSFTLNDIQCNCLPAGSTNAGTVTLTSNADGTVTFNIDLNDLLDFHDTNAFDLFAFSYDGLGTLSLVGTSLPTGVTLSTTAVGSGSMDGAGHSFNEFIDCSTCIAGTGGDLGVNVITFTVAVSAGNTITASSFETLSGNSDYFAAAVTKIGTSGCTGVVGGGGGTAKASTGTSSDGADCNGTSVPDGGATVGLLGLALLGLGYLRARAA